MTNKVKPFFIRITDDMTPQMVQDAFDKCVDAGVVANESIDDTKARYKYFIAYLPSFEYFGVNEDFETYLTNDWCNYGAKAQEITLDQLDEWLVFDVEQEWKNGDECEYKDEDDEWSTGGRYVCYDDFASHHVFYATNMTLYHAASDQLRKPETQEQKAERERLEAAYDLYCHAQQNKTLELDSFDVFIRDMDMRAQAWLAVVDKTNYRKQ